MITDEARLRVWYDVLEYIQSEMMNCNAHPDRVNAGMRFKVLEELETEFLAKIETFEAERRKDMDAGYDRA